MDTTNIDPATLLRLAADRLEALAARATPGPWVFRRETDGNYDEIGIYAGRAATTDGASGLAEEFIVENRDLGHLWESLSEPGEQTERLAGAHAWMATLHPGVVDPLAGWLRYEAGRAQRIDDLHPGLAAAVVHQPGRREALEFARLVLASAPVPQGQPQ